MILVTRLNGPVFALNPDLIERADSTPDTVVSLVDGTKYVITESVTELVERIKTYRASVLAQAHRLENEPSPENVALLPHPVHPEPSADQHQPAPVVRLHRRDS